MGGTPSRNGETAHLTQIGGLTGEEGGLGPLRFRSLHDTLLFNLCSIGVCYLLARLVSGIFLSHGHRTALSVSFQYNLQLYYLGASHHDPCGFQAHVLQLVRARLDFVQVS